MKKVARKLINLHHSPFNLFCIIYNFKFKNKKKMRFAYPINVIDMRNYWGPYLYKNHREIVGQSVARILVPRQNTKGSSFAWFFFKFMHPKK